MSSAYDAEGLSLFDTPESCPQELRVRSSRWEESCGTLSRDERALMEPAEPHELAVDGAISALLLGSAYAPEDFLSPVSEDAGGPKAGERENAYTELRLTTGYALQVPTPANFEAIGRAVVKLSRLAMRARAIAALSEVTEG